MSAPAIRALWLYPGLMNVYADRGNAIALRARCAALGVGCELTGLDAGGRLPEAADLVLIGGGQDREQRRAAPDLARHAETLRGWAAEGTAMLAVCGGFQLFGRWYRTAAGEELPGAGIFDAITVAPPPGAERCIGDVLAHDAGGEGEVVGFENHAGRTYLGPGARPFAYVEFGYGNNGGDRTEGAVAGEAIGTYLHGSLLPRHPALADRLIRAALRRRYGGEPPLPPPPADPFAARAHRAAAWTARRRGRPAGPPPAAALARGEGPAEAAR